MKRCVIPKLSVFVAVAAALLTPATSDAGVLSDLNRYPATIPLVLNSSVQIENGSSFFTQSDTPDGFSLHSFETYNFIVPADTDTDVGLTLNGPDPFGVFKSFSSQHHFFIGTYTGLGGSLGLAVLLKDDVGIGETFESVFPGYNEADVITSLVDQSAGVPGAQFQVFLLMASSLAIHAEYAASGPDQYELGPAHLVQFSDGVAVGSVVTGQSIYRITGGPLNGTIGTTVPEPSTFALLGFGGIGLAFTAYRNRRQVM